LQHRDRAGLKYCWGNIALPRIRHKPLHVLCIVWAKKPPETWKFTQPVLANPTELPQNSPMRCNLIDFSLLKLTAWNLRPVIVISFVEIFATCLAVALIIITADITKLSVSNGIEKTGFVKKN
jgi:hypothetical protein